MERSKNVSKEKENFTVNDINMAKAILQNINWNFHKRSTYSPHEINPFNCRTYHWFPATFIPEIPFTLIEILTFPNAVVYDPFGGLGTTYFQALLLNRKPLTTEISKVAIEYMRSLFILFNPEINNETIREKIGKILENFDPNENYVSNVPKYVKIGRLTPWYSTKTLNQISYLFIKTEACDDKATKATMRIAISANLKTVSSQNRGWGCIADNVLPKIDQIREKEVFNLFNNHINGLLNNISKYLKYVTSDYNQLYKELSKKPTIYHGDIRICKKILDNSVDLVVTSPPYPNMTSYVTSQRLSYYFMGYDLVEDLELEIGSRNRRFRKDSIDRYLIDMKRANEVISQKIKKGGYACYVMPVFNMNNENNMNRRLIVQKVISDIDKFGLIKEDEYERILPTIRRSHNIKWATLEREKIHLFRKV